MRFVLSFLQGSVLEYAFCTRHNSPLSYFLRPSLLPGRGHPEAEVTSKPTSGTSARACRPHYGNHDGVTRQSLYPRTLAPRYSKKGCMDPFGLICGLSFGGAAPRFRVPLKSLRDTVAGTSGCFCLSSRLL